MAENKKNTYPTFVEGQVLTADLLNDMVSYLSGESKDIRANFYGNGILSGLTYSYNSDSKTINVDPGVAVTIDGDLIKFQGGLYYLMSSDGILTLVDDAKLVSQKPSVDSLSNYVLVLKKISKVNSQTACNQTSCNVNGVKQEFVYVPALMKISGFTPVADYKKPLNVDLNIKRLMHVSTSLNVNTLNINVIETFKYNRDKLVGAVTTIESELSSITNNFKVSPKFKIYKSEFIDIKDRLNHLDQGIEKSNNVKQYYPLPYYFLSFLEDIRDAISEFVEVYNEFFSKYALVASESFKDSLIVLGKVEVNLFGDPYRYVFVPRVQQKQYEFDCKLLERYLLRINLISQNFKGMVCNRFIRKMPIKLIPVNPNAKLGDRIIPYYYDTNDGLLRSYWSPNHLYNEKNISDVETYKDFSEEEYAHKYPFEVNYCLQGVYRKYVDNAKDEIERLIDYYDLPIKVETVQLSKKSLRLIYKNALYDNVFNKDKYQEIKDAAENDEKVKAVFDKLELIKGDVNKYIDIAYKTSVASQSTVNKVRSVLEGIKPDEIAYVYKHVFENDYTYDNVVSMYCNGIPFVTPLCALRSYFIALSNSEYEMADLNNVAKYRTIVLAYFNKQILFTFGI